MDVNPDVSVAYREEVHHPALTTPEIAEGNLGLSPDGRLIKDQLRPRREISEIGERFVTLRNSPEAEANLLPIPGALAPMLDAMRLVLTRAPVALSQEFEISYGDGVSGWVIDLLPKTDGPISKVVITGCGQVLTGFEILNKDGARRLIKIRLAP